MSMAASYVSIPRSEAHLEGLRVPVLHFLYRGHVIEPIWKVSEFLYSMCEPYGELFGEELRCAEQSPYQRQMSQSLCDMV
jgi:hypothetical protein